MKGDDVQAALEILLKAVDAVAEDLKDSGAKAMLAGQFDAAKEAAERASRWSDFQEKVAGLQQEWSNVFAPPPGVRPRTRRPPAASRLERGLRTPQDAFRRPILEALVQLGGSTRLGDVLDKVEARMQSCLNRYDYEPLRSTPKTPRWRKSAQWCRNTMAREGLIKAGSPWGTWEISDRGRDALRLGRV